METEMIKFLVWCIGIHCFLLAMMDAASRNSFVLFVNYIKLKLKGGVLL